MQLKDIEKAYGQHWKTVERHHQYEGWIYSWVLYTIDIEWEEMTVDGKLMRRPKSLSNNNHGGQRPNAGRKPNEIKNVPYRRTVNPSHVKPMDEYLNKLKDKENGKV